MRKTAKKGFTLMELIIVLALFSVIMVLVMSFIDPAAKLMTKTSTREKTAAYVDNINEYVDKSLRYATFIRIFESDFCLKNDETPVPETDAVQEFIEDYFDGAIDSKGNPVTGKVHVLKLLNEPSKDPLTAASSFDGVAGTDLKDGVLVDTVYDFKAGDSMFVLDGEGKKIRTFTSSFPHASITGPESNDLALNSEHFRHYSYFYKLGFQEFVPVSERTVTEGYPDDDSVAVSYNENIITNPDGTANMYSTVGGDPIAIKSTNSLDFYYKELIPMRDSLGNEMSISTPNKYSFAVTSVAYPNDAKGDNKVNCTKIITDPTDSSTRSDATTIFKSPCYMATSSMSFANIQSELEGNISCVMKDQDVNGADKPGAALVAVTLYADPFSYYKANDTSSPENNTSNIFFVFVVPSEVNN